jgi:(p)ppGpp synthase/HD superfamily hydrolase
MLEKAIRIATESHEGQTDKAGKKYILHPLRAMNNCETDTEKICAVLHDVIEDTEITLKDLENEGFSDEILRVLDLLTKRHGENYDSFIGRICTNEIACRVKIADLEDNMDSSRLNNPTEEDLKRQDKYVKALERIRLALNQDEIGRNGIRLL